MYDDTEAPDRLGPYKLLRRIGHGGMCEVHLAEVYGASGFARRVALKFLLPERRGRGAFERLMIKEARLGASLRHRNLVQIDDFGVDRGIHYMRLEYVDGADLRRLLTAGELPSPELALMIAAEVALALAYLHECVDESGRLLGLVHRDVTPSNILLSRAGEVKLTDFGVIKATKLAADTQGNVRKGKYAYMSPEQVRGDGVEARSDQFGLGITLMEMLCGRRPYDGAHVMETMEQIEAAEPPDVSGLDEDLAELLTRCLAPTPEERFRDAEALWRELERARRARSPSGPLELAAWVRPRLEA